MRRLSCIIFASSTRVSYAARPRRSSPTRSPALGIYDRGMAAGGPSPTATPLDNNGELVTLADQHHKFHCTIFFAEGSSAASPHVTSNLDALARARTANSTWRQQHARRSATREAVAVVVGSGLASAALACAAGSEAVATVVEGDCCCRCDQ